MRRLGPRSLALALPLVLAGCGLHPLYSGGSQGTVARELSGISVAPIPGKAGWLVHNAIADRLSAVPEGAARYRLTVTLDDQISGMGVRANDNVTRERRMLRARYQLQDITAGPDAKPVLDDTASADAGIDVSSSEYATVAAEDTALERLAVLIADRILARVAINAVRRTDGPPATGAPGPADEGR